MEEIHIVLTYADGRFCVRLENDDNIGGICGYLARIGFYAINDAAAKIEKEELLVSGGSEVLS